jgi:hypothetical protein
VSFASFLREKQYLENVSTNTLRWYRHAFKWLPSEHPNEQELNGPSHEREGHESYGLQSELLTAISDGPILRTKSVSS